MKLQDIGIHMPECADLDFRYVPETNERYLISNTGVLITRQWKGSQKCVAMSPAKDDKGYLKTMILVNGKNKNMSIHRMVCLAWLPNPENKAQINHKNFNTSDNSIENLEWCTHQENTQHKIDAGGRFKWNGVAPPLKRGSDNGCAKLNEQQVKEIREKFQPRIYTREMLAKEYGVSPHTIKDAILRRWKHVK